LGCGAAFGAGAGAVPGPGDSTVRLGAEVAEGPADGRTAIPPAELPPPPSGGIEVAEGRARDEGKDQDGASWRPADLAGSEGEDKEHAGETLRGEAGTPGTAPAAPGELARGDATAQALLLPAQGVGQTATSVGTFFGRAPAPDEIYRVAQSPSLRINVRGQGDALGLALHDEKKNENDLLRDGFFDEPSGAVQTEGAPDRRIFVVFRLQEAPRLKARLGDARDAKIAPADAAPAPEPGAQRGAAVEEAPAPAAELK
jgi:hypothetical protein